MLIDNRFTKDLYSKYDQPSSANVADFLSAYLTNPPEDGFTLDACLGYFSLQGLDYLASKMPEVANVRLLLGVPMPLNAVRSQVFDLLNPPGNLSEQMKQNEMAKRLADWLKQPGIELRSYFETFVHAKAIILKQGRDSFVLIGSSNLTVAGIGLNADQPAKRGKVPQNIELNLLQTGSNMEQTIAEKWFNLVWEDASESFPQAPIEAKDAKDASRGALPKGAEGMDIKTWLISLLEAFYKGYTPEQIYTKTLQAYFSPSDQLEKEEPSMLQGPDGRRLKETEIWNKLYPFQQDGANRVLASLERYDMAMLGDAVGLGKTFIALAVIKAYERKGFKVLLVCPNQLKFNWSRYHSDNDSELREDGFEYKVCSYHDLRDQNSNLTLENFRSWGKHGKVLIVFDESHNLRNEKGQRYKWMVERFIQQLDKADNDVKVLMLSATPINTSFNDLHSQFTLGVKGRDFLLNSDNIAEFGPSLKELFRETRAKYEAWSKKHQGAATAPSPSAENAHEIVPAQMTKLLDAVSVARSRKIIKEIYRVNIHFPLRVKPEANNLKTPFTSFGRITDFEEVLRMMDYRVESGESRGIKMCVYTPLIYISDKKKRDQIQKDNNRSKGITMEGRQKGVAAFRFSQLAFRMESSWVAFQITLNKIIERYDSRLESLEAFRKLGAVNGVGDAIGEETIDNDNNENEIGDTDGLDFSGNVVRPVRFSDFSTEDLAHYETDMLADLALLNKLKLNICPSDPRKTTWKDDAKMVMLVELLEKLRADNPRRKIIVFTSAADTLDHLYGMLKEHPISANGLGAIKGGDIARLYNPNYPNTFQKEFSFRQEAALKRFAPFVKLYLETNWHETPALVPDGWTIEQCKTRNIDNYKLWRQHMTAVVKNYNATPKATHSDVREYVEVLDREIDLLFATDCVSEGQNLQEADVLIHYDVFWNPVRLIQREGRIDRIGTPHEKVHYYTFWPGGSVEKYLKLYGRVKDRIKMMGLVSSDDEENNPFADDHKRRAALKQVAHDEVEDETELAGNFPSLSALTDEHFKADLEKALAEEPAPWQYPDGAYTGCVNLPQVFFGEGAQRKPMVLGLLGWPRRVTNETLPQSASFEHKFLFAVSESGEVLSLDYRQVLSYMRAHHEEIRSVPPAVDAFEPSALVAWEKCINQAIAKFVKETKAQNAANQLQHQGGAQLKPNAKPLPSNSPDDYVLITWWIATPA